MSAACRSRRDTSDVECNICSSDLTKNQAYHEKTKYIDISMYFVKDVVSSEKVKVLKDHTYDNPANIITKAVTSIKFERSLSLIGVTNY